MKKLILANNNFFDNMKILTYIHTIFTITSNNINMNVKLLLLLLIITTVVTAQEPYRHLMITECNVMDPYMSYVEITNTGDKTVNLSEFRYGTLGLEHPPILDVLNDPWTPSNSTVTFMLPDVELEPGKSYVITG